MKVIVMIVGLFALSNNNSFCQCPPSYLKIQTPICDSPRNLKAEVIDCSKLKINWLGTKDQTYIVEATYIDPETNSTNKQNGKNISCDDAGNCSAIIAVKEGVTVNWNVQSQCSINDVILYSYKIQGDSVLIPYCAISNDAIKSKEKPSATIHVYPNPTKRFLNVEYLSRQAGNINFQVYNTNGVMLFETFGFMKKATNKYTLDLRNLPAGTYFLQIKNSIETTEVKFILMNN